MSSYCDKNFKVGEVLRCCAEFFWLWIIQLFLVKLRFVLVFKQTRVRIQNDVWKFFQAHHRFSLTCFPRSSCVVNSHLKYLVLIITSYKYQKHFETSTGKWRGFCSTFPFVKKWIVTQWIEIHVSEVIILYSIVTVTHLITLSDFFGSIESGNFLLYYSLVCSWIDNHRWMNIFQSSKHNVVLSLSREIDENFWAFINIVILLKMMLAISRWFFSIWH